MCRKRKTRNGKARSNGRGGQEKRGLIAGKMQDTTDTTFYPTHSTNSPRPIADLKLETHIDIVRSVDIYTT